MSTNDLPNIEPLLIAAERAGATLTNALTVVLAFIPDEPRFSGVRGNIVESAQHLKHALDFRQARDLLAEAARPKGPMVEIVVPSTRGRNGSSTAELESVTAGALIMRGGERYSRRTGQQLDHAYNAWTSGAPYITEAERARVLALPRPPAPARPRKEPRP